jgi:hypothetical protein
MIDRDTKIIPSILIVPVMLGCLLTVSRVVQAQGVIAPPQKALQEKGVIAPPQKGGGADALKQKGVIAPPQ